MTDTIVVLDAPTSEVAAVSQDSICTVPSCLSDPDVTIHTVTAHLMLIDAWRATMADVAEPPPWLYGIATRVVGVLGPLPATPSAQAAHQWLAAALTTARIDAAVAGREATDAQQVFIAFRADVRRRAAHAVNNEEICLYGTNQALARLDVDLLQVEYEVELLIPVTVRVRADNEQDAYEQAESEVRADLSNCGLDLNTDDLRQEGVCVSDEQIDPDDLE